MLGCGRKTARSQSWEGSFPQKTLKKLRLQAKILAILGVLAWKIPWMEEPGGLQSIGSLRVRHN